MSKSALSEKPWDRFSIFAEVKRQGMTLTGIAKDAGLHESACRMGLLGTSRPGAEAIAAALNVPFRTLFPSSYTRGRHDEQKTSRNLQPNASQKAEAGLDTPGPGP